MWDRSMEVVEVNDEIKTEHSINPSPIGFRNGI